MAGTKEGGKRASKTNLARHGLDYYRRIAYLAQESYLSKPKSERKPRGFAAHPDLAKKAGALGGSISKRTKK